MRFNFAVIAVGLIVYSGANAAPLQYKSAGSYPGQAVQSTDNDYSQVQPGNSVVNGGSQGANTGASNGQIFQTRQASSNVQQSASADSHGGDSKNTQVNDGDNGKDTQTSGGPQVSDNSAKGGSIEQNVVSGVESGKEDSSAGILSGQNSYNGTEGKKAPKPPAQHPHPHHPPPQIPAGILSGLGSGQDNTNSGVSGTNNTVTSSTAATSGSGNNVSGSKSAVSGTDNSVSGTDGGAVSGHGNKVNRRLFAPSQVAQGSQKGTTDAFGGSSAQGAGSKPVSSGAGNSLTSGGGQNANDGALGGSTTSTLTQGRPQQRRQWGPPSQSAQSAQQGSADAVGGHSAQGQENRPVLSGAGNSLTSGGEQSATDSAQGGKVGQSALQGHQQRRQWGPPSQSAQSAQHGSADAVGGHSTQGQQNRPVLSGAGNSLTSGGEQGATNAAQGGSVGQSAAQGPQQRRMAGYYAPPSSYGYAGQQASADGYGGQSYQGQNNAPVVSGSGNSVTTGGDQGADNSAKGGSTIQSLTQGLKRRQAGYYGPPPSYGYAGQQGSADAYGGNSYQGQYNAPVVSGSGNSVTTGGAQNADNSANGGSVTESLTQKLGFRGLDPVDELLASNDLTKNVHAFDADGAKQLPNRRQYGAVGQGASANGVGGASNQFQKNCAVVSGAGNSVTDGGAQGSQNAGAGGKTSQTGSQILRRQYGAAGQGASADGFGGQSAQGQVNCGVVSGFGNSLTEGGSQGASNPGAGGETKQGLSQLFHARQYQPYPYQPYPYSSNVASMNSDASAYGGHSSSNQFNGGSANGNGNSITQGGPQTSDNSAQGGSTAQSLTQSGPQGGAPQGYYPYGQSNQASQGSDASGHGGSSFQGEHNSADVNGNGNSVTQGGPQSSNNQGYGGQTQSSLSQL